MYSHTKTLIPFLHLFLLLKAASYAQPSIIFRGLLDLHFHEVAKHCSQVFKKKQPFDLSKWKVIFNHQRETPYC